MPKAYIILKAAATALVAAACAQGPLHISKFLWVAGRWASSEAHALRSIPGLDTAESGPTPTGTLAAEPAVSVSAPR
jgi:hypothetical protein